MLIALCLMLGGCAGYDDAARRKPKRQKFFGKFWGEDDEEDEEDEQGEYEDSHLKLSLIDSGYDVFSPAEGVSFDTAPRCCLTMTVVWKPTFHLRETALKSLTG